MLSSGCYVHAWVPKPTELGTNGYYEQLKYTFGQGLSTGHAVIELRIPATPQNKAMVNTYIKDTEIEYFTESYKTCRAKLTPEGFKKDRTVELAFKGKQYVVYWSLYPDDDEPVSFNGYIDDSYHGWARREFNWSNPRFKDYMPKPKKIVPDLTNRLLKSIDKNMEHSFEILRGPKEMVHLKNRSVEEYNENLDDKKTYDKLKKRRKKFSKDIQDYTDTIKQVRIESEDEIETNDKIAELNTRIASLNKKKSRIERIMKKIKSKMNNFEKTIEYTEGVQPDYTTKLDIDCDGCESENGLNVESMLKKMRELVLSSRKFGLYDYNCSESTLLILEAGAKIFPDIFRTRATGISGFLLKKSMPFLNKYKCMDGTLDSIATPYIVARQAEAYKKAVSELSAMQIDSSISTQSIFGSSYQYFNSAYECLKEKFAKKNQNQLSANASDYQLVQATTMEEALYEFTKILWTSDAIPYLNAKAINDIHDVLSDTQAEFMSWAYTPEGDNVYPCRFIYDLMVEVANQRQAQLMSGDTESPIKQLTELLEQPILHAVKGPWNPEKVYSPFAGEHLNVNSEPVKREREFDEFEFKSKKKRRFD